MSYVVDCCNVVAILSMADMVFRECMQKLCSAWVVLGLYGMWSLSYARIMLECFEFSFGWLESLSHGSNLHLIASNLVRMLWICIRMVRIPFEWLKFAFKCFESSSNGSNLKVLWCHWFPSSGCFLRLPSLHVLVFLQKTFCDLFLLHFYVFCIVIWEW